MSGLDIFAWIVLIILVASIIAVFCIAGWLPGHIAKTRGHPQAQAVTVAGWVTLICGFALWPIARDAGRGFDVQQRQSEVDQLKAQLESAKWNLDKTVVRAPADGYATNVALRKGARVANLPLSPVMAFIDTSDTLVGVEINQNDARYVRVGQPVEVTFKFEPGVVRTGKVEIVFQA